MRALTWKASDELNAELMLDLLLQNPTEDSFHQPFPSEGRDLPDDLLHDRSTHALTTDPTLASPRPRPPLARPTSPMNPYLQCRHAQYAILSVSTGSSPLSPLAAGGAIRRWRLCWGQGAQHPARGAGDPALLGLSPSTHWSGHHRSQRGTAEPTRPVFLVQLAFFAADGGLVTYTLATKWQAGAMPALLFAVAMGLHIFATDHVLAEHFPVHLTAMAVRARRRGAHRLARRRRRPAHRNSADQHIDRVSRWRDPAERLHRRAAAGAAFQLWLVRGGSGRYALLLIFATVAGKPGAA